MREFHGGRDDTDELLHETAMGWHTEHENARAKADCAAAQDEALRSDARAADLQKRLEVEVAARSAEKIAHAIWTVWILRSAIVCHLLAPNSRGVAVGSRC